ncbi:MAG: VanZ family protein [Bacteroidales bacterium]|nr:VanZ family protein [Bacteroidales bacterium]
MHLQLTHSAKSYSSLFRIFLVIFVALYFFLPAGLNFHKRLFFHCPCDYLGHALFCFILFFLYINSFDLERTTKDAGSFLLKLLGLALVVCFLEVIQQFVPHRSFDWFDILSNITGMVIGTVVGMEVKRQGVRSEE